MGVGRYAVVIESLKKRTGIIGRDHDDFIVGDLGVRADKPIVPIGVRAE